MVRSHFRVRKLGGGHQGFLKTPLQRLLIVLVYCKSYSTYYDDLGSRFGLSKSAAFDNVDRHFPKVQKALARLGVLPARTFHNIDEFKDIFSDIAEIILDVTERQCHRPQNSKQQQEVYIGKKMPTYKNTIISTFHKLILFVGLTFTGHHHDYKMFKSEFPNEAAWFKHLRVFVDLGYQGIVKDYEGENILIPYKNQ